MIIIATTTPNYGLYVTPETDTEKSVLAFRTEQAGDGSDSNIMKLDSIIKNLQDNKASLVNGKIPSEELPSYVDDVLEFELYTQLPASGEQGKIYVIYGDTRELNGQYRWTGTTYASISNQIDFATKEEAEAGENNSKAMTALRSKELIESLKSRPNGVAGLDVDNKVFPEQLPTNLLRYGDEEVSSVIKNDADTLSGKTIAEITVDVQTYADDAVQELKDNPTLTGGIPIATTFTPEGGVNGVDFAVSIPGLYPKYGTTIRLKLHNDLVGSNHPVLSLNGGTGIPFYRMRSNNSNVSSAAEKDFTILRNIKYFESITVSFKQSTPRGWVINEMPVPVADDIEGLVLPTNAGLGRDISTEPAGLYPVTNGAEPVVLRKAEEVAADIAPHINPVSVGGIPIVTTYTPTGGTDGVDYAADVPGVTEIYEGLSIIFIPHVESTGTAYLTINNMKRAKIGTQSSQGTGFSNIRSDAAWIGSKRPILMIYRTNVWLAIGMTTQYAENILGIVPVVNGGSKGAPAGSYPVGNGDEAFAFKTPAEVCEHIGALPLTGGTMTGDLDMGGRIIDFVYRIGGIDGSLHLGSDSTTTYFDGWAWMNGNKLGGLPAPKDPTDAANKQYVDDMVVAEYFEHRVGTNGRFDISIDSKEGYIPIAFIPHGPAGISGSSIYYFPPNSWRLSGDVGDPDGLVGGLLVWLRCFR